MIAHSGWATKHHARCNKAPLENASARTHAPASRTLPLQVNRHMVAHLRRQPHQHTDWPPPHHVFPYKADTPASGSVPGYSTITLPRPSTNETCCMQGCFLSKATPRAATILWTYCHARVPPTSTAHQATNSQRHLPPLTMCAPTKLTTPASGSVPGYSTNETCCMRRVGSYQTQPQVLLLPSRLYGHDHVP